MRLARLLGGGVALVGVPAWVRRIGESMAMGAASTSTKPSATIGRAEVCEAALGADAEVSPLHVVQDCTRDEEACKELGSVAAWGALAVGGSTGACRCGICRRVLWRFCGGTVTGATLIEALVCLGSVAIDAGICRRAQ